MNVGASRSLNVAEQRRYFTQSINTRDWVVEDPSHVFVELDCEVLLLGDGVCETTYEAVIGQRVCLNTDPDFP